MTTYFVYQWENIRTGKRYVGSHKGTVDDGYIGSGLHFKRAYQLAPNDFVRTIIQFYESYEDMKLGEESHLIAVDAAQNPLYYNLTNESSGGNLHSHLTDGEKSTLYQNLRNASAAWFTNATEDDLAELKAKKRSSWKTSPKREAHVERTRARRQSEEANKTEEDRAAFKATCKESYWNREESAIAAQHAKQSNGMSDFYVKNPDVKRARKELLSTVNVGRIAIRKDGKTKKIKPDQFESFQTLGWELGQAPRKRS